MRVKKRSSAKKSVKKAVARVRKQPLVKLIKNVIKRQEETKIAVYQDGFNFGGGAINASNIVPLTPFTSPYLSIVQGTGQGDRIGNRIRVKSAIFRYTLYPSPYNAVTNIIPIPQHVRLWFFSVKESNSLLASNPPNFIQNGDSSSSLTGTLTDLNRVMNNDLYTYLGHRTHKIGYAEYFGTGASAANEYFRSNDYKLNVNAQVNLTKMYPKQIKYNDTGTVPSSKLIMVLWESINADGSSPVALGLPCYINFQVTLKYTDA